MPGSIRERHFLSRVRLSRGFAHDRNESLSRGSRNLPSAMDLGNQLEESDHHYQYEHPTGKHEHKQVRKHNFS